MKTNLTKKAEPRRGNDAMNVEPTSKEPATVERKTHPPLGSSDLLDGKKERYAYGVFGNSKCRICGADFVKKQARHSICSKECLHKYRMLWQTKYADNLPNINCEICGSAFKPRRNETRFCSQACSMAWVKKTNPNAFLMQKRIPPAEDARLSGNAKQRGKHGSGGTEIDNPNHASAKFYRVRSPLGDVIEAKNLQSFCRKNELLFRSEEIEWAKTPLWKRAAQGLRANARGITCSWHGWTAVCVFDIEADPLARRVALPSNEKS